MQTNYTGGRMVTLQMRIPRNIYSFQIVPGHALEKWSPHSSDSAVNNLCPNIASSGDPESDAGKSKC